MIKKNFLILSSVIISAFLISGCQSQTNSINTEITKQPEVLTNQKTSLIKPAILPVEAKVYPPKPFEAGKNVGLADYTAKNYEQYKGKSPYALFFNSESSVVSNRMEQQLIKDKMKLPDKIVLMRLNYDKEKELEKKLNVENAAVWLIFNKDGELIARNSGEDLNSLILDFSRVTDLPGK